MLALLLGCIKFQMGAVRHPHSLPLPVAIRFYAARCMRRQSPHIQQPAVTTGLCAGSKSLASGYQNASITIKALHIASCQADMLHLELSVKQFKQSRNHGQLLDSRSFILHERCSARPDNFSLTDQVRSCPHCVYCTLQAWKVCFCEMQAWIDALSS